MTLSDKHYVIHECLSGLSNEGYRVNITTDHEWAVQRLMAADKDYLTPNMSPHMNDFTGDNCIWILLEHGGIVVGGIGARRDRLGSESLGSFWRKAMKRQYGEGTNHQIASVSRFIDEDVRGNVTYFGDLVLAKSHRANGNHLRNFTMYCQMAAATHWDSDWQYSFISEARAENGGAYTYGFAKVIPGAQEWLRPTENRRSSECCVISSRVDLQDIAAYLSRSPNKLRIIKHANTAFG